MRKNFSDLQKQDMDDSEKKHSMKAAYIVYRTTHIAVLLYFGYELYLRVTTGRPISNLLIFFLLLTAPAKIYKNIQDRNIRKENPEELRRYDKMILRSIIIGLGIVTVFVIISVFVAINN